MNSKADARRLAYLSALAVLLGLIGGAASWVLLRLIALLTNLALLHQVGWKLPSLAHYDPQWWLIPTAMLGGLIVALLAKWSPVIRGHGIPEAMEAVLQRESRISPRAAVAKPASAAIAIGTGGPFGAEGPIIVTGGAFGSLIGQVLHVSPAERKILLAAGAAAGMSATFGAPLAAIVLAIELLLFEFSPRAFVPLAVASSVAAGVHAAYAGTGPLFEVPAHSYSGLAELPAFAVLGIACGFLAALVCKGLFVVEHTYRRLPIPDFWHPVLGGLLFGLVGMAVPRALGVGYDAINDALASKLALGALVALFVGKLLAWWFALGSGTSGGTLAPVLLVGATFGGLYNEALAKVVPSAHIAPVAIVVVAMAATFGASTPRHLHRDHLRVRAHARLPGHPALDRRGGDRRPRIRRAARPSPHDREARAPRRFRPHSVRSRRIRVDPRRRGDVGSARRHLGERCRPPGRRVGGGRDDGDAGSRSRDGSGRRARRRGSGRVDARRRVTGAIRARRARSGAARVAAADQAPSARIIAGGISSRPALISCAALDVDGVARVALGPRVPRAGRDLPLDAVPQVLLEFAHLGLAADRPVTRHDASASSATASSTSAHVSGSPWNASGVTPKKQRSPANNTSTSATSTIKSPSV